MHLTFQIKAQFLVIRLIAELLQTGDEQIAFTEDFSLQNVRYTGTVKNRYPLHFPAKSVAARKYAAVFKKFIF